MWTEIGKSLPVREIFRVLARRRKIFVSVFVLIALVTAVVAVAKPTFYEASAMILVKRSRGDLLIAAGDVKDKEIAFRMNAAQEVNSEAALLRSRSLLIQVVKTLSAAGGAIKGRAVEPASAVDRVIQTVSTTSRRLTSAFNDLFKDKSMSETDRAIVALEQRLTVTPIPVSNLIRVSYRAYDPATAERVVNTLVKLYRERYIQLHKTEGANDFFGGQVKELDSEVQRLEGQLKAFDRSHQITNMDKDRLHTLEKLNQFETSLNKAGFESAEMKEELTRINALLAKTPEHIKAVQEMRYNPVLPTLKQKLVEMEIEKARLLQNYMPRDQRVRDMEKQIESLRAQIVNESVVVSDRESVEVNLLHRNLLRDRGQAEIKLAGLEARSRVLQDEVNRLRKRARDLEEMDLDRIRLERQVKVARDTYSLYMRKHEETRMSAAMDQSGIVNVTIAEPATRPLAPVDDRRGLIILAGFVLGLVGGMGAAFVREMFDNSFSTRETVEQSLNLPVIVSIPEAHEHRTPKPQRTRRVH
jgi:uncharacterized protein involved in exopolysaccharide biosynthesis